MLISRFPETLFFGTPSTNVQNVQITVDKLESKSQVQAQRGKEEFGFLAVSKILWPPLPTQYRKKQVDSKRKNTDESNMFKENIIKEMF